MKRHFPIVIATVVLVGIGARAQQPATTRQNAPPNPASASGPPAGTATAAAAATADPNQALINRYCVTCHNQRLKTASLTLDTLALAHPEQDAVVWERAIRKLRAGMMPPPGA